MITRADDYLVTSIEVRDPMLSDHLAVHCKLGLQKTPPVQASIQYKKYALIDMDSFNNDLKKSTLLSYGHDELPSLLEE